MTATDEREFELKLALGKSDQQALARHVTALGLASGGPKRQHLVSTYFDTPQRTLFDAGMTLRLRRNGRKTVQTVKAGRLIRGGISNPDEIETAASGDSPSLEIMPESALRRRLGKLINGDAVGPMFSTDVRRRTWQFSSNGFAAELALDSGQVVSDGVSVPISEAELELKKGDIDSFLSLAEQIFSEVPLRFSRVSKSHRGFLAIGAVTAPPVAPLKSPKVKFSRHDSIGKVFEVLFASASAQVLENWQGVTEDDDPSYAHQMRIGIRRMRTMIKLLKGLVKDEKLARLNAELRALGQLVGELRNSDVMIDDIVRPAIAGITAVGGSDALLKVLKDHREIVRARVRADLLDRRFNGLRLRLALLPHGACWRDGLREDRPVALFAHASLARLWKKAKKQGERLERLSIEERHELRKDLKTLRYALESFAPVLPRKVFQRWHGKLKALQDSFGYLNDVALAAKLPAIATGQGTRRQAAQAAAFVVGWHAAHSEIAFSVLLSRWRRLADQTPPWA
ncbi:MAG: CHAD domain-containing protein [Rhodobiaceae bacterium]|nr:CHAD domain-containing protein [Rhodobiaceae bacterium]MCC0057344.1 CHAD domain-containing protein [Rhodobiaceae bacterium]